MTDNSSTLLKVQLSEYVEPAPVVPDTDDGGKGSSPGAGDHGFQTIEAVGTEEAAQTTSNAVPIAFVGLAFFILIFIILSLVKKRKNTYSLDNSNPRLTKLQVASSVAASVFLAAVFNSALFSYTLPTAIETTVSEELTIDANILGTDNIAYVKDTITIPASQYGYDLYISTDDSGENRLIADSSEGVINSITTAGALQDNTYGFSFVDPAVDATQFHPIQPKSGRTSVRFIPPEQTTVEQHIPIWYAVRSKSAPEDVYRVNIEYKTIGEQDITLQEMTPELCADLEVGILDYFFTNELDGEQYNVLKLADGNCWTKPIEEEPEEPVKVCPTGWHEANNYNYNDLAVFYDVNNPETTSPEAIVNLKKDDETGEFSCIADFDSALISFDSNGVDVTNMPDDISVPSDEPQIQIQNFVYTIPELPALETDATCQDFLGWSLLPDATEPLYPVDPAQPQPATFSSPRVTLYAVWSNAKTAKAILDENGLLNFVYDYCPVEDLEGEGDIAGYKAAYEAEHGEIVGIYNVRPDSTSFGPMMDWYTANMDIITANFEDSFYEFLPTSTAKWFQKLSNLTRIDNINNLNTSKVLNMYTMFNQASSLEQINYRNENGEIVYNEFPANFGSEATNMESMFSVMPLLTSLTFPVSFGQKATDMNNMFISDNSLEQINYRNKEGEIIYNELPPDFGRLARNMCSMFQGNKQLASITFPTGFGQAVTGSTSVQASMESMFEDASSLTSLTFPDGFGLSAISMDKMFKNATGLVSITFPASFGQAAIRMSEIFYGDYSLQRIYVPDNTDWYTENIRYTYASRMFTGATSLIGENGVSYSSGYYNNIVNAHIDNGTDFPGYFTRVCMKDNSCPAESSGNSASSTNSLNYAPFSIDNTESESTDSTPSSESETLENPSGEGPAPLGVAKTSKTDNSTMILFAIAMTCLSSGTTLFILMIEKLKREYSEEEEQML